jgi:hypothetical protein
MAEEPRYTLAETAFLLPATSEPDPVTRFRHLTRALTECDRLVSRIADERAACTAEMHAAGQSLADIARQLGGTRARAQQLVKRGRKVQSNDDH